MEGLGQRKLIYLGGVLRGMTQIRHIFRKVAVMHTKIMLLYFVKVTGDVFFEPSAFTHLSYFPGGF